MAISVVMHSPGNVIEMPEGGGEATRLHLAWEAWKRLVSIREDGK